MVCVFCVHKKVSSDECLVFVVSATKISTWKMSLSFFLFLFLSLSLSLNDLSIFSIAVLFLGISLLILDKCQRIVRPLVLGTLFRASSFRSRVVRCNERKRCFQSLRGTFASSTKYLRQSSRPYLAACTRSTLYPIRYLSFFNEDISRCLSDHRMLLVLPHLLPSLAKVSLCRKEIEDSRGVLQ